MTYKKYDPLVQKMIIETQNPNLFPELSIPRSTALYWIRKSKRELALKNRMSDYRQCRECLTI